MPSVLKELFPGEQGLSWPAEEAWWLEASSSGNSWCVCHQQSPSSFDVKDYLHKSHCQLQKHGNKFFFFFPAEIKQLPQTRQHLSDPSGNQSNLL